MRITAVSHTVLVAVLVVVSGIAAVTVCIAATKSDRNAATRNCLTLAAHGTGPARLRTRNHKRQMAIFNECMEQAGFGYAKRK
jgi:hypothetical protein